MMMKNIFWSQEKEGRIKIKHNAILEFLENEGFANVKIAEGNYQLVRVENNLIAKSSEEEINDFIVRYLKNVKEYAVLETFLTGLSTYTSRKKLALLSTIELINDRDSREESTFYFNNCFCRVDSEKIECYSYEMLEGKIWRNRILNKEYKIPENTAKGQYEVFCENISKNNPKRILALKTALGYLLHRHKDVSNNRAIIFYDENMGVNAQAHGGTGKTLLGKSLQYCREIVEFNGKELKKGSFFKNQRIELTTDILFYDDLQKGTNLEEYYTLITSGIEIEKKGKQSIYLEVKDSPKILMTSNYPVEGDGGSSDLRRRYEFELANYYSNEFKVTDDFGNLFFDDEWGAEWNLFYRFMMDCVQTYLKHGLVEPEPINLKKAKVVVDSSKEFYEFMKERLLINELINKRDLLNDFIKEYPSYKHITPHTFHKWLVSYAKITRHQINSHSSGGNYYVRFEKNSMQKKINPLKK